MEQAIRVSSLGLCARRVFYSHQPELQSIVSPEAQRKMSLGHLIETLRRRELRREGVRVFAPQREVAFGPCRGHIDGYLKTSSGPVLWEAKSTTGFSLTKWMKEGLPRAISFQVHGYMKGLSDLLGERIAKTQLEVVDRTSGEVHSWQYEADPFVTAAALERAQFLHESVGDGVIPSPEFDSSSTECRYCPFRQTCRPELSIPEDSSKDCLNADGWNGFGDAVQLYLAGQELKDEGEQLVSQAKETLQTQLHQHGGTKARAGDSLVLWSQVETTRFDGKALQAKMPEVYAQFLKPSTYTRFEIRR
jgi:hypothetical protein